MFAFKLGISLLLCFLTGTLLAEEAKPKPPVRKQLPLPPMVTVKDKNFYIGDKPYRFLGTNMWYGPYLGMRKRAGSRIRLIRELKNLQQLGVTNVRFLGSVEASPMGNVMEPLINSKGEFNEEVLKGLDFALASMSSNKMRAVIYLNNFWSWSGGMSAYASWSREGDAKKIPDPSKDSAAFAAYAAQFYSDEKAQQIYHNFVKKLLNRKNDINQRLYKDDPNIMAWELSNAPRVSSKEQLSAYYAWVKSTTQLIKSIDKKHLVTVGSEGTAGCLDMQECVLNAHKDTGVDYMTFQLRPTEWGWVDIENTEKTYEAGLKKAEQYIEQQLALADKLNMPLVLNDFAFSRDGGRFSTRSGVENRNKFFRFVYEKVEESIQGNRALVGSNFWSWGGVGQAQHGDGKWREGDYYFVGDTPRETQGVNSVFESDSSTLRIMDKHQRALKAMNEAKTLAQNKSDQ